ncbi:MAG: hypothetical protein J6F33_07730, partial [Acidaminococcaceae bacterium]|nr:hypothetical protein [Acidaminococcaceae bacterium]
MSKKAFFCLIAIFCFLYVLNCLMPLCFGDDYLYSFTWQGLPMYVPLGENAVRISSWHDLILSQYSHYMTWSGRLVAHTIIQYFLWKGKDIFNIFNAFVGVIFILEIYWCVHKGKVSLNFECGMLFGIFFILWSFSPDFTPVFLWLTGACNYLWSSVLLLGFLIPFIQKYYLLKKIIHDNKVFNFVMTALGILAGWTNENSVCWIIVLLFVFICYCHKAGIVEIWMYTGLTGLIFGYGLLMFAPGNIIRLHSGHGDFVLQAQLLIQHLKIFFEVLIYQLLLWHFCFKSIYQLKYM